MKRPAGIIILGILCIIAGGGGLLTPLDRPIISFGVIHNGIRAYVLHIIPNLVGLYVGYGLLKPLRHIWYVYLIVASIGIISLTLNVIHEPKIWELFLLLQSKGESIPRLVTFTLETHYLLIAIYALTAMYIYLHKNYFWGEPDL
jgi:hypothetical protein